MFTFGILTLSDLGHRGQREDTSALAIKEMMSALGSVPVKYEILPDEKELISAKLADWADNEHLDLILTTGGTGLGPRDVTPEATLAVVDRLVPGLPEMMRFETVKKTPLAMLSRAVAGVKGRTLIVNLPGSQKAVRECLDAILPVLPHAMEILQGHTEHAPAANKR